MLSPPYSPHTDARTPTEASAVGLKQEQSTGADLRIRVPRPESSVSSSDEDSDNDVHRKRSALDAFGGSAVSEDVFDDEVSPTATPVPGQSPAKRERRMTTCWDALRTNPHKYLRQERSLLDMYPLRRHSWAGPGSSGLDDSSSDSTSTRSSPAPRRGRKPGRQPGTGRGRRRTSVGLTNAELSSRAASRQASLGPEEQPRESSEGAVGGALRVHDLSYHQLEDYSPCLSLLPPGKSLRAEWKGAPMDLTGDPDLPLLHPAEAHLASVLRLPCDVYLDSKRRLFAEKVHRLRQGLPFRRTDSQKACRIDVNKASRLFGAFEKIGWLEDQLFLRYLE